MKFSGVDYSGIDELLSDEEKMTRNAVRDFLEKEVEPLVADAFHREEPLNMRELFLTWPKPPYSALYYCEYRRIHIFSFSICTILSVTDGPSPSFSTN